MLDPDTIDLCSECLAGAATEAGSPEDLRLTAIAFARDIADNAFKGADALALLDAAYNDAITRIDSSDLVPLAFARSLRALAELRVGITAALIGAGEGDAEIAAAA